MSATDDLKARLQKPQSDGTGRAKTRQDAVACITELEQALAKRDATIAAAQEHLSDPYKRASLQNALTVLGKISDTLSAVPGDALCTHDAAVWDACLDLIEDDELNTQQARESNPYRSN